VADVDWTTYSYDRSQGNDTGTTVTLAVTKWTETTINSLHDYRSGQLLFRLDFRRPEALASQLENEARVFASANPGYKKVGLHSIDCPSGAMIVRTGNSPFRETASPGTSSTAA